MRVLTFAVAALACALPGIARAADLPPAPPPPAVAPAYIPPPIFAPVSAYNWTGVFVGGHIGYAAPKEEATQVLGSPLLPAGTVTSSDESGWLFGGQIGFNYQAGNVVVGFEADWSWSDTTSSATVLSPIVPGATVTGTSDIGSLGTLAGRVGYAWNNWLVYVRAGIAWMDVEYGVSATTAGVTGTATVSDTRIGWNVGAGAEVGFWNAWSARLQYDYLDFGTEQYNFTVFGVTTPVDIKSHVHMIRGGFNYRFGWAPIASRY